MNFGFSPSKPWPGLPGLFLFHKLEKYPAADNRSYDADHDITQGLPHGVPPLAGEQRHAPVVYFFEGKLKRCGISTLQTCVPQGANISNDGHSFEWPFFLFFEIIGTFSKENSVIF